MPEYYEDFYMNYVEDGGAPTHKHATQELAQKEAERLAEINRGKRVYVLHPVTCCEYSAVKWIPPRQHDIPDIPF